MTFEVVELSPKKTIDAERAIAVRGRSWKLKVLSLFHIQVALLDCGMLQGLVEEALAQATIRVEFLDKKTAELLVVQLLHADDVHQARTHHLMLIAEEET